MHNIYPFKKKRKNSADDDRDENEAPKKARKQYEINPEWRDAMDKDTRNKKMWDQVAALCPDGKKKREREGNKRKR